MRSGTSKLDGEGIREGPWTGRGCEPGGVGPVGRRKKSGGRIEKWQLLVLQPEYFSAKLVAAD